MDPDPGGRAGEGRGSRRERGERRRERREGEGRRAVLRLLSLREGDKVAASSSPHLSSLTGIEPAQL